MAQLASLSPELVECILASTLDGSTLCNRRTLDRLSRVSRLFAHVARRLLLRSVIISTPESGARLLESLRWYCSNATHVRAITFKETALHDPDVFSEQMQGELVALCVNLAFFDSPHMPSFAQSRGKRGSFPAAMTSIRLPMVPSSQFGDYDPRDTSEDESDDDDDDDFFGPDTDAKRNQEVSRRYLAVLETFPQTITSLKLSQLPKDALPLVPPDSRLPFPHLRSLALDRLRISSATFKWLTQGQQLEKLQLWLLQGPTELDLLEFANGPGKASLREFLFKPKGRQGKFVANEMVLYMTNLRKLTLGDKACDHNLWNSLPASLTHICVALPPNHLNAHLETVAGALVSRLNNVQRLELYSNLYFPPPVEVVYPYEHGLLQLRELRLSHIHAPDNGIGNLLSRVGDGLHTLAVHHIEESTGNMLHYCRNLRRLELGAAGVLPADVNVLAAGYLTGKYLSYLRVHFAAYIPLADLVSAVERLSSAPAPAPSDSKKKSGGGADAVGRTSLRTLELVGRFPDDVVSEGWRSGAQMRALVDACAAGGVELCVNGRVVEGMADLWCALFGQTGREEL